MDLGLAYTINVIGYKNRRVRRGKQQRPANEISQDQVDLFLDAVSNYEGDYPKVRDLKKLLPSIDGVKLVTILKYLVKSGTIIVDSDSNIIWTSGGIVKPEGLTLAEVADIPDEFKRYL